jgi:hypothetical protein
MIDAGSVNTQAIARLRTVVHCNPDLLANIRVKSRHDAFEV